jgi:hypothetical protein
MLRSLGVKRKPCLNPASPLVMPPSGVVFSACTDSGGKEELSNEAIVFPAR